MLFLSPFVVAVLHTTFPAEPARLEQTARADGARHLAAQVLLDADALVDLVLVDRAAMFEVELAGERHELRVELGEDGLVVGAALWWLGPADADLGHDLAFDMDALEHAGRLDYVIEAGGKVALVAGRVAAPIGAEHDDEDLEDVDGDGDEEWGC